MSNSIGALDMDLRATVATHDKQLGDLTMQVQSLAADVRTVTNSVAQLSANTSRLEAAVSQNSSDLKSMSASLGGAIERLMTEWRQRSDNERQQLETRPSRIVEYVRAVAAIVQATIFAIGSTVAAIVYVSSNANNADLAVMRYRLEQAEKARERSESWAPTVDRLASVPAPAPTAKATR